MVYHVIWWRILRLKATCGELEKPLGRVESVRPRRGCPVSCKPMAGAYKGRNLLTRTNRDISSTTSVTTTAIEISTRHIWLLTNRDPWTPLHDGFKSLTSREFPLTLFSF